MDIKKLKKINFKQPKYIFPLVILLPLLFLVSIASKYVGGGNKKTAVVSDSINMSLPDADNEAMQDKMTAMNSRMADDGAYTAVGALGDDEEQKDSTTSGYSEGELDRIDAENAERARQQKALEDMQQSLARSRRHINSYEGGGSGYGSSGNSGSRRQNVMDEYASEVEAIRRRSEARQKAYERSLGLSDDRPDSGDAKGNLPHPSGNNGGRPKGASTKEEAAIVRKVDAANADKFHTLGGREAVAAPLIRAMIDKTTKAHEGTRLRFKLLDDVTIKGTMLRKGTYLYGTVTGFGQQRVMAGITSILVRDKFIKVSLSVYDNDGMEGFYVPESAFRDMMRDAGAQAVQNNITFDNGGSELSGEAIALQALQNMYQSASGAVAGNLRKNKARIKYNTIVYLINTADSHD